MIGTAKQLLLLTACWLLPAGVLASESIPCPETGQGESWQLFHSEPGRFAVRLPAEPRASGGLRETAMGKAREGAYSCEADGARFRVEHHDIPRIGRWVVGVEGILERAAESFLGAIGARRVEAAPTSLAGEPGRALSYVVPGSPEARGEARLILVKNRLYIASVHSRGACAPPVDAFFGSFDVWYP